MKKYLIILIAISKCISLVGQSNNDQLPKWVTATWAKLAEGTGIWIADNPYFGENIPYDSYGMKWTYGPGKTALKGRLYGIRNGKDVFTLWEFLEYWHPGEQKLLTVQYGKNDNLGNLALGESIDTGLPNHYQALSLVYGPGGKIYHVGHKSEFLGDENRSQSFDIVNGQWQERGSFTWKRQHYYDRETGLKDYQFILGGWRATHKTLKKRLQGDDEWLTYEAVCKAKSLMNGNMIVDDMIAVIDGKEHTGTTVRIFNSINKEWTIYWASDNYPDLGLSLQVKGKFENGKGTFYGQENHNGEMVKLRWQWSISENGFPHWEQAYFDNKNDNWETNWVIELER